MSYHSTGIVELVRVDLIEFFRSKLVVASTMLTSVSMVFAFGIGVRNVSVFGLDDYFTFLFSGIVALGIMFSCTYTIGYSFIVDRGKRTIEDIVLSPISYTGFILGRLIGMSIKSSLQLVAVLIVGVLLFNMTEVNLPVLLMAFLTEAVFFGALGILVATFTNEISFAGLINIILIPLTHFSGVFFPISQFGILTPFIQLLPLSVHIPIFRAAFNPEVDLQLKFVTLSIVYALISVLLASYWFKRRVMQGN